MRQIWVSVVTLELTTQLAYGYFDTTTEGRGDLMASWVEGSGSGRLENEQEESVEIGILR